MAWTAPRTWVTGELVTAAIGNVHWRDNFNAGIPVSQGKIVIGDSASSGPLLLASAISSSMALISDSACNAGARWRWSNPVVLAACSASTGFVNSGTENTLFSYVIPACTIAASGALKWCANITGLNNTGAAQSWTFTACLGGSATVAYAITEDSNAASRLFNLEVDLWPRKQSSASQYQRLYHRSILHGATSGSFRTYQNEQSASMTGAQTFAFTAKMSGVAATMDIKVLHSKIEYIDEA